MSDTEVKQVSGEPTQDKGLPQPQFSEKEPASPTSALPQETIAALRDALTPVIEETIERKFKSTTDKRFSRLEQGEGVLKDVLTTLKAQGVSLPPQLEQKLELQDYVDQQIAKRVGASGADKSMSVQGAVEQSGFNAVDELTKLGLNTGDPDVVALVSGKYRNPDHFRYEAAALALKKAKPQSTSSPSLQSPMPGGASVGKPNAEEINEKITLLNRLYKTPTQNKEHIARLEKELEAANWGN